MAPAAPGDTPAVPAATPATPAAEEGEPTGGITGIVGEAELIKQCVHIRYLYVYILDVFPN